MASRPTWSYLRFGSFLLNVRSTDPIKSPQHKLRAFFCLCFVVLKLVYLIFFSLKKERISSALVLPRGTPAFYQTAEALAATEPRCFGIDLGYVALDALVSDSA